MHYKKCARASVVCSFSYSTEYKQNFDLSSLRFTIIAEGKEYICDNAQEH